MAEWKDRYSEHLNSPAWNQLRKQAYERADHRCELCSDQAEAVHHVKYPKSFDEDCLENLLVVCDRCHKLLHGLKAETILGLTKSETFFLLKLLDEAIKPFKNKDSYSLTDMEIVCATMGILVVTEVKRNMFRSD